MTFTWLPQPLQEELKDTLLAKKAELDKFLSESDLDGYSLEECDAYQRLGSIEDLLEQLGHIGSRTTLY